MEHGEEWEVVCVEFVSLLSGLTRERVRAARRVPLGDGVLRIFDCPSELAIDRAEVAVAGSVGHGVWDSPHWRRESAER